MTELETKDTEKEEVKKLNLESIKIKDIIPYSKNAKLHPEKQIEKIRDSIISFGYCDPIAVDENNIIIEGHGRLLALKQINSNPDKQIQVIKLKGLSENEKKAYRIAHNKIGMDTDFDLDILKEEFYSLEDTDNFEDTGFDTSEISEIWDKEVEEDNFEEPKESKYKIELGEIWECGNHRVMCGDSTIKSNVDALMGESKAILMVTDPPYGVEYNASWREDYRGETKTQNYGKVKNDDIMDWSDVYSLFNPQVIYNWHASWFTSGVQNALEKADYKIISSIIWVKSNFALSRGDYHWQHEPCWYAVKNGENHNWQGSRKETTKWEIMSNDMTNPDREETWGHSTQKPLECMSRPIINNTSVGQIVCDPFGGSGTTLIACEKLNRKCFMMELDERYVSIILERWEKLTNKKAVKLESNEQISKKTEDKSQYM